MEEYSSKESHILDMKLTNRDHIWKISVFPRTWVISVDNEPICIKCQIKIKDTVAFMKAIRRAGIVDLPQKIDAICQKCYLNEYPGRVAFVEVEDNGK